MHHLIGYRPDGKGKGTVHRISQVVKQSMGMLQGERECEDDEDDKGKVGSIRSRLHSGVRLTAGGHFVHHHFQAAEPIKVETVTDHRNGDGRLAATTIGNRNCFVAVVNEHTSLEMGCTTATGPGRRDIDHSDTVTNNRDTQQSNFPQADLFPHSSVTTSSVNMIQATHHICAQEQHDELEGTDVSDEVVCDADALSPLDSDVNHAAAMMWGNSCLGAPFVVVNGMTVIPNRVDEPVHGSELSPSCMEDEIEWYHISQAVVAAAKAASQLEHAAAESQSSALATTMDTYIEWPEEDSEVE
ncbi:uncharacterized protein EDB93DRAFT_1249106 [Suillus bovinus]|uniref:uncharacterized protein n=1 Tax=Suillus bovinus TaxID=48563 RepID=UPI001B85CB8F|nr:uncharacterized protein EDB93DRAFT_1249106 [Suillus bovinus]KAG2152594.1 hypothetical protein EDB93DRAFT_1249106 [Suillus bovinus]